jgi:putative PEP-CTERM system TPR-repeat lipoprotein
MPGCGNDSAKASLAAAKTYLDKRDTKSAIVELRNTLQQNPKLGEARFLLGKALLDTGDTVGASVELGKAAELKYPAAQVLPLHARTLLNQGENRKLIDLYGRTELDDPAAVADLKTSVATAHAMRGERDQALKLADAVLAKSPDYAPALLLKARELANTSNPGPALELVSRVIAKDGNNAEAWYLGGLLSTITKHDPAAAIDAYRKSLAIRKDYLQAHSGIISVYLEANDLDHAKAQLDALKAIRPNHPQTRFLEVQLAWARHDYKTARSLAQQALTGQADNFKLLELAGLVELELGSLAQARAYLGQALQKAPELLLARRALAQVYLQSGQPQQAIATLRPRLEGNDIDARTYALAGQAYLQSGDAANAETYFRKAAKTRPDDTKIRTSIALAQLSKGDNDSAFSELQSIATQDDGASANLALISERLRRNDLDGALKAIDALALKQPDKAYVAVLRGRVMLARGDRRSARDNFERALKIDPGYYPGTASLAGVDVLDNKPEQARKRLEDLLRVDPKNHQAMLALADLRSRTGGTKEEVRALMSAAVKASPGEAGPRVLLVKHHLAAGEARLALTVAQEAASALPDDPEVLGVLGSAQTAAGDAQQAIGTFNKLAGLQPTSAQPHLRLAEIYFSLSDNAGASRSLKRALEIVPNLLAAQRGLIKTAMAARLPDEALGVARTVQRQRPKEAIGFQLEGDVHATQARWDAAIAAFRTALQKAPSGELAAKLDSALIGAGKKEEAARLATEWQKAHPQDAEFLVQLGATALARREFGLAESRYRAVIKLRPDDAPSLNNIAWLMLQQKKQGALAYAENAARLVPDQPSFLDTLAEAQAEQGDLAKAVEAQKKAVALAPNAYFFRLNLARIYLRAGNKAAAKTELDALAKLGDKFPGQAEVKRLLTTV